MVEKRSLQYLRYILDSATDYEKISREIMRVRRRWVKVVLAVSGPTKNLRDFRVTVVNGSPTESVQLIINTADAAVVATDTGASVK